ncbi:MAG: hypothetical protein EOO46_21435 [Flavobacterium sp.]|nr:MAG: hypothetical protein EOO46_21435 [Flavobacterium sp.]
MKKLVFISTVMLAFACSSSRNSAGRTLDIVTVDNESLQLKNDTLYFSTGLKFFVGQQLVVGNPAGDDGYYRSIVYKSAIVPSIWGQDKRYDHAIENHVNVKKSREGVKRFLGTGKPVTIKGIGLWKNSKPNFYFVNLASGSEVFGCDIQFALSLKELSFP